MVGYTGHRGSPKRKRIEPVERTAQEVAETDATLHMFTSQRRSSWMQNASASLSPRESATGGSMEGHSPGNSAARQDGNQTNNNPHGTANGGNVQTRRDTPLAGVQWNTRPVLNANPNSEQPSEPGQIVDYELPHNVQTPTPLASDITHFPRPSSKDRLGLLSPALSDRNTISPADVVIVPDGPGDPVPPNEPLKRPRGRPPKHPRAPVASDMSMNAVHQHPSGNTAATTPPGRVPLQITVPSKASPRQPNRHASTPTSNLSSAASRPQNPMDPTNFIPSPRQGSQQDVPQRPQLTGNVSGLFDGYRMEQLLKDAFRALGQDVNEFDNGRKHLLLEAAQKGDFFYLVLHQLFCLYSWHPALLPPQLCGVPPAAWATLDTLLCPSHTVTPRVLHWFSEFPASIQVINTSRDSFAFAKQVDEIKTFLQWLPGVWPALSATCHARKAPPLIQELVQDLRLSSPVLQTTVFRAIARGFWRGPRSKGFQILEELHREDQETYINQHWRRTVDEMMTAIGVLAYLFKAWNAWCSIRANLPDDFNAPPECSYFLKPTQNARQGVAVDTGARLTASQRQHLLAMNSRVQAQRQTTLPGLSYPPQGHVNEAQSQIIPSQLPARQLVASQQPSNHSRISLSAGSMAPALYPTQPLRYSTVPQVDPHLPRLLPPANAPPRPQPAHPDTLRVSLHQAHLRSPAPGKKELMPGEQPLYRHVIGYVLAPTLLDKSSHAQSVTIPISQEQIGRIPTWDPSPMPGGPGIRLLNENSHLYRLRCSRLPPGTGFKAENSWVTADNVWPDYLTFQLNGHFLEERRKLHHGRYLPIDLSPHLRAGDNILNAFSLPHHNDRANYAVAIEIVGITTHAAILSQTPTLSSNNSLTAIKNSLSSAPNGGKADDDDDDDIGITSSTLTIPLFDPFRADRICDVPVRGTACPHRECFDLETFLSQCKREQPGYPSVADCWRCPICKGDVRPQMLVKDGFLMRVREELEGRGLLGTRAIVVQPGGSWEPKAEEKATGVRSASLEREEAAKNAMDAAGGKGKQRAIEVIELD